MFAVFKLDVLFGHRVEYGGVLSLLLLLELLPKASYSLEGFLIHKWVEQDGLWGLRFEVIIRV